MFPIELLGDSSLYISFQTNPFSRCEVCPGKWSPRQSALHSEHRCWHHETRYCYVPFSGHFCFLFSQFSQRSGIFSVLQNSIFLLPIATCAMEPLCVRIGIRQGLSAIMTASLIFTAAGVPELSDMPRAELLKRKRYGWRSIRKHGTYGTPVVLLCHVGPWMNALSSREGFFRFSFGISMMWPEPQEPQLSHAPLLSALYVLILLTK